MITVTISINGQVLIARSAVNIGREDHPLDIPAVVCRYEVDDGRTIEHDPALGAIPLAIEMLRGVREPRRGTGRD